MRIVLGLLMAFSMALFVFGAIRSPSGRAVRVSLRSPDTGQSKA